VAAAIENVLKKTRSEILSCLRAKGRLTADELATTIGLSRVCIRRHLELLSRDELIAFDIEKHDRGRPAHVYYLTPKSRSLFSPGYTSFARGLLKEAEKQFGEGAVSSLIAGCATEVAAVLRTEIDKGPAEETIHRFVALLNRNGYEATLTAVDGLSYVLEQQNCPMLALAVDYDQICEEELRAYREVLGGQVNRECRIAGGHSSCIYKVKLSPAGGGNGREPKASLEKS
jgi:predicted ArsR family transcriptional regulator